MIEAASVLRNLRYWTLHVTLNAAPSYLVARDTQWKTPEAAVAMVAGVAVFIGLFTAVQSSAAFRRFAPPEGWRQRALVWGTRARSTGAALSLLGWIRPQTAVTKVSEFLILPDVCAGILAVSWVQALGKMEILRSMRIALAGPDAAARSQNVFVGDIHSLLPTFAITLAEGLLLTVELLAVSLLCGLIMHLAAKRRARRLAPVEQP